MEFSYMRALLEEVRMELTAVFEHGFHLHEQQEQALAAYGEQLQSAGLQQGAQCLQNFCGELRRARLDPGWSAEEAARVFARLWKYISLCRRRLEYFQAAAQLRGE
jgi:hypothetical protein